MENEMNAQDGMNVADTLNEGNVTAETEQGTPEAEEETTADLCEGCVRCGDAAETAAPGENINPNQPADGLPFRPALVVINAAELAEMDAEELARMVPKKIPAETVKPFDDDDDDDENGDAAEAADEENGDAADEEETQEEPDQEAETTTEERSERKRFMPSGKAKTINARVIGIEPGTLARLWMKHCSTKELADELRLRLQDELDRPNRQLAHKPLSPVELRDYLAESCESRRSGNLASLPTQKLLDELQRRERARLFARKLAAGEVTETEAKVFFADSGQKTRVFLTWDDEDGGKGVRVAIIRDDCDCETDKGDDWESVEIDLELLGCAFISCAAAMPHVRRFSEKFSVICEDPHAPVVYTTDYFDTPYEAQEKWNEYMEELRETNTEKVMVYDSRIYGLAKTCQDAREIGKSLRVNDMVKATLASLSDCEVDPELAKEAEAFRDRPGGRLWMEAMATSSMGYAVADAILLISAILHVYADEPSLESPTGRYSLAVVAHGAECLKEVGSYLNKTRDELMGGIMEAWMKSKERPDATTETTA